MVDTPQPPVAPFEWVATPETQPIRVKARRWQQYGFEVISAPCPVCQPGVSLPDSLPDLVHGPQRPAPPGHLNIHVNQPGRIICKCGAYLELYVEEDAPQ